MKNFQQNLLIVMALALCGLCAWQWYFQTVQRARIDKLDQTIYRQLTLLQANGGSIKNMEAEISGQQARIAELKQAAVTNDQTILAQKREMLRLQFSCDALSNEIVQYQSITNALAAKLRETYDGIRKQNEAVKELVAQRDDAVQKYNDGVKARNELTTQYNELVERFNKLQNAGGAGKP
jgi:uncharacterized coiled-coil DUF342 family protein